MAEIIIPLIGPEPLTEAWHALRRFDATRQFPAKVVFGATKAAAICGMSPYSTPLEVFVECMIGLDKEVTDAMEMGRIFEDPVLDVYERKRKVKVRRGLPMFFHGCHKWMGATPDALVETDPTFINAFPDTVGPTPSSYGVDAKTSTFRRLDKEGDDPLKFGVEGTDQMPVDYVMQAQQQCEVLNLPYVEFPVMFSRDHIPIYRVDRNDDLIELIIAAEQEMYERLVANDPPEPNWTHSNTRELIGLLKGHKPEVVTELDEEDVDRWLSIQRLGEQIADLKEQQDAEKNHLLWRMGEAAIGRFPSGETGVKRVIVKDSLWTDKDVDDARNKVGTVKRKGHERLIQTKIKE